MQSFFRTLIVLASLFVLPALSAAADLEITEAWVRMPPPVADTAAAYMQLKNTSNQQLEIVKIESDVARLAEFHSMKMHDGMMYMGKMEKVRIPPGEALVFSTGGNHLMLIDLKTTLTASSKVALKLITQDGTVYKLNMDVRDMRKQSMQHQHHH